MTTKPAQSRQPRDHGSPESQASVSRRQFIGGALGTVGIVKGGAGRIQADDGLVLGDRLLRAGFESGEPSWYPVGNQNQEIVELEGPDGENHALALAGAPGGCWEALADIEVPLSAAQSYYLSGWVSPTTDGEKGCHDHRAKVALRTATGSWDAGSGISLCEFGTNGTFYGTGGEALSEYVVNKWHRVEIVVDGTASGEEIVHEYYLNDTYVGSVSRAQREYETDLQYLRLASGEFETLYDGIELYELNRAQAQGDQSDGSDSSGATGEAMSSAPSTDSSDDGVLDSVINVGAVLVGLYLLFQRFSSDTGNSTAHDAAAETDATAPAEDGDQKPRDIHSMGVDTSSVQDVDEDASVDRWGDFVSDEDR